MNRLWLREAIDARPVDVIVPRPSGRVAPAARSTVKRAFDVVAAASLLVALAPLMLLIAFAVRLDSRGPAIFRQTRTGLGGATFSIFKFRTMRTLENGHGVLQARRHDHRITRLGAFLRRTSLDELPQLLNVLRGDMSLVGPRPHAVAHDRHYGALVHGYAERFRVRPGMTGLAQVNGARGPTETVCKMERRVRLDLAYVERWSWEMEWRILVKTLRVVVRGDAF